ncbi:MAG: hypothetical protein IJ083_17400 [Clostridia bacterium]|nr:hypothetical protein [Clostridia bacterium]
MGRFRNVAIGGIQNKVFHLILFTVLILTSAFMAVKLSANPEDSPREIIRHVCGGVDGFVKEAEQFMT